MVQAINPNQVPKQKKLRPLELQASKNIQRLMNIQRDDSNAFNFHPNMEVDTSPTMPKYVVDQPLEFYDKLAIVISISDYSNLRNNHGKYYLKDQSNPKDEVFRVRAFLSRHGFNDDKVKVLEEPSLDEVKASFNALSEEVVKSKQVGKDVALFVYFTGIGAYLGNNSIIVSKESGAELFNIDDKLNDLCFYDNCYIFGLMNCERIELDPFSETDPWRISTSAEYLGG